MIKQCAPHLWQALASSQRWWWWRWRTGGKERYLTRTPWLDEFIMEFRPECWQLKNETQFCMAIKVTMAKSKISRLATLFYARCSVVYITNNSQLSSLYWDLNVDWVAHCSGPTWKILETLLLLLWWHNWVVDISCHPALPSLSDRCLQSFFISNLQISYLLQTGWWWLVVAG